MIEIKWMLFILNVFIIICSVTSDLQPIDVEPAIHHEHADFEDDTGQAPSIKEITQGKSDSTDESWASKFSNNSDGGFKHAFIAALSIIIVSELGDKTFFIAAIMAMNNPRLTVFVGAMTALAAMHIMSALFGHVITIIPRIYTFYISSGLFAIFGIQMLREGLKMAPDAAKEELEEVQSDLRRREESKQKDLVEEGLGGVQRATRNKIFLLLSTVFLEALTLTFFAEWGDRSQIATVVLAARENVFGVIVGGLIGHFLCTGLAVIGGRMIASKISVKTVTILGGVTFILFAISALIIGP